MSSPLLQHSFPVPEKKLGGQRLNLERIWKILLRNARLLRSRVRGVKKQLGYEGLDWVPYPRKGDKVWVLLNGVVQGWGVAFEHYSHS